MADYYNFQQLGQLLGISVAVITDLQRRGLLEFTVKNGREFLSCQQAYRLRVAIRRARKDKMELSEAFSKVEERWQAHSGGVKV